jgi:hypothetical protein
VPPFPRGASIGLLERLEDDALLLERDADARVADREPHDAVGLAQHGVVLHPPLATSTSSDAAALGELERVGQEVLEHLQETLGSVVIARPMSDAKCVANTRSRFSAS